MSGAAMMLALVGGGAKIDVLGASASDTQASVAFAGYALQSDGEENKTESVTTTKIGDFCVPASLIGLYECRLTGTGDTPSGPTLGTWNNCGTTRNWGLTQSGSGSKSFSGTISVRLASSGTVLDSASVSLSATVL